MSSSSPGRIRRWGLNRRVYLSHVVGLIRPSMNAPLVTIDTTQPADLTLLQTLDPAAVKVMIDEGRRTQDAGATELEGLRTKAQFAFTTCLVLLGVLTAELPRIRHHGHWCWVFFLIAGLLSVFALTGALAVLVNNVVVSIIHPGKATHYGADIEPKLARDYALNAKDWINLNGTLRAVLREAVLYLTLAALCNAAVWVGLRH